MKSPHFMLALALLASVPFDPAQAQQPPTPPPVIPGAPVVAAPATVEAAPAQPGASEASSPADQAAVDASADANATDASGTDPSATPTGTAPTQAELDYAALYGDQEYNPIADPTLPPAVQMPASYDPWEKLNRKVHRFNNGVDRYVATPLAHAYVKVVPRPVRLGVGNFFNNLGQPLSAVNSMLQGHPGRAGQALERFLVNSTIGVVGLFDPATHLNIPNHSEDFGQTLGVWGWKRSRYVELPLFGPRTVRDVFGLLGDGPLAPLRTVQDDKIRVFLQGLQLVDVRTQLFAVDSMRRGATDEYALTRDAWLQRRRYQIFGDRDQKQDDALPEYLREDQGNPSVPAEAVPILPTDPHY